MINSYKMKKIFLLVFIALVSSGVKAQFEAGRIFVNPAITGLDFTYSNSEKAHLGVSAKAGAFLADNVALLVELGADLSKPLDVYTAGTGARYYFSDSGVFLGAGLDYNYYKYSNSSDGSNWGLGIEAGYAFFLSRTVTIEPSVYYKWRFNNSDLSKFGLRVGFGLYF